MIVEWFVLALAVLALILAATPAQRALQGHASGGRRFGRAARARQAQACSPERKA